MHARQIPGHNLPLVVGSVVIVSLIFAPNRYGEGDPGPLLQAGEAVLFDGSQQLTTPDRRGRKSRSERTESRIQRQATALLREAMSLPQEIPTPPIFRMYEERGQRIVFPKHGYEQAYLDGWNECLYVIGNTYAGPEGRITTPCFVSFKNDMASSAGLAAGFDDCQRRIVSLARIYNLDLIRKLARELHREIPGGVPWERKKPAAANGAADKIEGGKTGENASEKTP